MPPSGLDPSTLLGAGLSADVYSHGPGRVVKLFRSGYPRAVVDRKFRVVRAIHAAGLPAPAVHDFIERDGRCGFILERIEGPSLFTSVQAKPWTLFRSVRLLADLHAEVHRHPAPPELPSQRETLAFAIRAATHLSPAIRDDALARLAALPDRDALCHGDFHPANIILSPRGPIIIDWDGATRGDPLCDVAITSRLMLHASLPAGSPRHMHFLLATFRSLLHRAYLRRSLRLRNASPSDLDRWRIPLAAAAKTDRSL